MGSTMKLNNIDTISPSVKGCATDSANESKISRKEKVSRSERWEEMFRRLLKFREKHGHCVVPNRYSEDRQLGTWVSQQRRHMKALASGRSKSMSMTQERAQRLAEIGFDWDAKDKSSDIRWETQFIKLLEYVITHGHPLVPIGHEDAQLANWVSTQRQEYKGCKKGGSSSLTTDRVKLLNAVGFVWEAPIRGLGELRRAFSSNKVPGSSLSHVQFAAKHLLGSYKEKASSEKITESLPVASYKISCSPEIESAHPHSSHRKLCPTEVGNAEMVDTQKVASFLGLNGVGMSQQIAAPSQIMNRNSFPSLYSQEYWRCNSMHSPILTAPLHFGALSALALQDAASGSVTCPGLVHPFLYPPLHVLGKVGSDVIRHSIENQLAFQAFSIHRKGETVGTIHEVPGKELPTKKRRI